MADGGSSFDSSLQLEGGRTYYMRILARDQPVEMTVGVAAVNLYSINVVNDSPYGCVVINDGSNIAYEGKWIGYTPWLYMNDDDTEYDFAEITITDGDGNKIPAREGFSMPASDVWIRMVIRPLLPITVILEDPAWMDFVETENHMRSGDNAAAMEGQWVRMYPYCSEEGREIGAVTVRAADGTIVPCFRVDPDADGGMPYYQFTMPGVPVTVSIRPSGDVPDFEEPDFVLPEDLVSIGEYAFAGVTDMEIVDAHRCTAIGAGAFSGCTGLKQIRLAMDCEIDEQAFDNREIVVFAPACGKTEIFCNGRDHLTFVAEEEPAQE